MFFVCVWWDVRELLFCFLVESWTGVDNGVHVDPLNGNSCDPRSYRYVLDKNTMTNNNNNNSCWNELTRYTDRSGLA
jgi:hypothetical protein